MSDTSKVESLVSSDCREEAEKLANILNLTSQRDKDKMELFMEAVKFWERPERSA
ncbi:hypothetical protein [Enterocloster lavalensis]|uniref:hypothetical protein n=1 Tax=Enterocloster lavalensis TaxID=460384 RepID=UPI002665C241|nr:hypothetical protein [Enterocloster lavalensis]